MTRSKDPSSAKAKKKKIPEKKSAPRQRTVPSRKRQPDAADITLLERYLPGGIGSLLDSIDEAVLLTDLTGKHLYANRVYYSSLGCEVGQDPNPDGFSNIHPDDVPVLKEKMKGLLAQGSQESEYRVRHKDGTWRHRSARTRVVHDPAGNASAFVCVSRDVTERKRTEGEIAERSAMMQQIMDTAHIGIGLVDTSGCFKHANKHMAELFGCALEELLGSSYADHVHPAEREAGRQNLQELLTGRSETAEVDRRYIRKDGGEFWGHVSCKRFCDSHGNSLGLIGAITDITDQKKSADALRESESKLSLVLDNVGAYIFIKDRQYRYTYVNKKTSDLFEKTAEEIIGKPDAAFFDPESVDEIMRSDRTVIEEGKTVEREEVDLSVPEGEARTYWTVKLPLRDSTGAIVGLCGISTDISERKRTEEIKNRLLDAISASTEGISITDDKDRFIYVNDAHARIYGYPRQELLGKSWRDLTPPDLVPLIEEEFGKTLHNRAVGIWSGEAPTSRKDGTLVPTEVTATARWDGSGNYLGHICVVRDITERKQAEAALWDSRNMLNQVLNTLPQSVFWKDRNSVYLGCNDVFARAAALERSEEIAGKTDFELPWGKTEAIAYRADDQQVITSGKPKLHIIEPQQQADGSRIWIDTSKVPLIDRDGNVFGVLGVYEDITERVKTEKALAHSHDLMRYVIEHSRSAIAVHDRDLRYIYVSQRYLSEYNVKERDIIGKHHYAVFPDLPQKWRDVHQRALAGEVLSAEDDPYERADGSVEWTRWECRPWYKEDGSIGGIIVYTEIITDRKRAEARIRENEQFIRGILDTVDEGFIVISRDYRILTANKAYSQQVGLPGDEIIGKHCYTLSHGIDRPCHEVGEECVVRKVLETGKPEAALHRHRSQDGNVLYVETKGFPVRDQTGEVVSVIETINNITERHLLEEERLKTQKLESIGTLAGGIAHDFNNLLQGVFGYISLAKMKCDDREKSVAALEQAEKALHQSVSLTSQLLTFSKGGKPARKRIFLQPVIENAVKFALSGSRSEYQFSIDPDLWPVDGDAGQLGQVIQNIVLNADQAMPMGGRVVITARNVPGSGSAPGSRTNQVEIRIEDSGVGIPERYLNKIFDPYFTTKEKGSGLGLATAYSIVRNHNGQVRVESEPGKGSTFFLFLPAAAVMPEPAEPSPAAPAVSGRSLRILAMDDEDLVRTLVEEMLRALGHDVETASHGEEALAKYQAAAAAGKGFDAVILDYTIRGGMGGAETIQRLKELNSDIKAIVSSGYSDDDAVMNFRKKGFIAFLKKPYDIEELRKTLQELQTGPPGP